MLERPKDEGDTLAEVWIEVRRLRDWRHDVAAPKIAALEAQTRTTADLLRETADTVSHMRKEDEFAARLADELRKRRWQALTTAEKAFVLLLATIPALDLALRLAGVSGP